VQRREFFLLLLFCRLFPSFLFPIDGENRGGSFSSAAVPNCPFAVMSGQNNTDCRFHSPPLIVPSPRAFAGPRAPFPRRDATFSFGPLLSPLPFPPSRPPPKIWMTGLRKTSRALFKMISPSPSFSCVLFTVFVSPFLVCWSFPFYIPLSLLFSDPRSSLALRLFFFPRIFRSPLTGAPPGFSSVLKRKSKSLRLMRPFTLFGQSVSLFLPFLFTSAGELSFRATKRAHIKNRGDFSVPVSKCELRTKMGSNPYVSF